LDNRVDVDFDQYLRAGEAVDDEAGADRKRSFQIFALGLVNRVAIDAIGEVDRVPSRLEPASSSSALTPRVLN